MRQGAGGVGDHEGVAGVGLRGAGVQVGEPAHDQAGQVGDLVSASAGNGDGQRADRGRLVDHGEDPAVSGKLVEQFPQPCLGVRQRRVVQPFTRWIQCDRVVVGLADVQSQEHAVLVVHVSPLRSPS